METAERQLKNSKGRYAKVATTFDEVMAREGVTWDQVNGVFENLEKEYLRVEADEAEIRALQNDVKDLDDKTLETYMESSLKYQTHFCERKGKYKYWMKQD